MNSENTILKKDREAMTAHHLRIHPAFTINKSVYMGDLEPMDLALAVCAGFHERPEECKRKYISDFLVNRDDWVIPDYGDTVYEEILFAGFIIIAINIVLLVYRRHRQSAGGD